MPMPSRTSSPSWLAYSLRSLGANMERNRSTAPPSRAEDICFFPASMLASLILESQRATPMSFLEKPAELRSEIAFSASSGLRKYAATVLRSRSGTFATELLRTVVMKYSFSLVYLGEHLVRCVDSSRGVFLETWNRALPWTAQN